MADIGGVGGLTWYINRLFMRLIGCCGAGHIDEEEGEEGGEEEG